MSATRVDQTRRSEEEDDDMMLFVSALHLLDNSARRGKKPGNTSMARGKERLTEIQSKETSLMNNTKRDGILLEAEQWRASWNPGLEKDLVDLLHEHNNTSFRGQKGWSSEAWNKIVKEFLERHPYVMMTKAQIQEKEKELKRDYRMLKEVRKQSGVSWNNQRRMLNVESAFWDNITVSFPKAKKFRRKPFPLFDALRELYDGHIAEGSLNFTSAEPSQHPIVTQVKNYDEFLDTEIHFSEIQERTEDDDDLSTSSEHIESRVDHEQNQQRKGIPQERKYTMLFIEVFVMSIIQIFVTCILVSVDEWRASWDPELEKGLVDLFHEHNNTSFRGKNGWSCESWNKTERISSEESLRDDEKGANTRKGKGVEKGLQDAQGTKKAKCGIMEQSELHDRSRPCILE